MIVMARMTLLDNVLLLHLQVAALYLSLLRALHSALEVSSCTVN
jgi:hypothetical protein